MNSVVMAPAEARFTQAGEDRVDNRALAGARRRKWRPTAEIDAAIREAYWLLVQENDRQALKRCARLVGWPEYKIRRRGAELGLARVKEPGWSLEEVAIVEANGMYGPQCIQKKLADAGYKRTQTAIVLKRRRTELTASHLGYSATALSKLMGIDGQAVTDWIERGMLGAERRGTERTARQGGDAWFIRLEDARAFLFAHPDEWDLRKVEKWWFLDLVTDGAISK